MKLPSGSSVAEIEKLEVQAVLEALDEYSFYDIPAEVGVRSKPGKALAALIQVFVAKDVITSKDVRRILGLSTPRKASVASSEDNSAADGNEVLIQVATFIPQSVYESIKSQAQERGVHYTEILTEKITEKEVTCVKKISHTFQIK